MRHCSSSQALNIHSIHKSRVYSSVICLYLNLFRQKEAPPPPGQELGFPEALSCICERQRSPGPAGGSVPGVQQVPVRCSLSGGLDGLRLLGAAASKVVGLLLSAPFK